MDIALGEMRCADSGPVPETNDGVAAANAIVGGQHQYIRLTSSEEIDNDETTRTLTVDVTVQNLTLQPMGTHSPPLKHANGVRVFFVEGPNPVNSDETGEVRVEDADGEAYFTGTDPQPFYRYDDNDEEEQRLGGDGILDPGEISAPKTWRFTYDEGVTKFDFYVLVHAAVPDAFGLAVPFQYLTYGDKHGCGLTPSGRAYCWGDNSFGQVGDGTHTDRPVPVAVGQGNTVFTAIAAGGSHTCVLEGSGQAWCWGSGLNGRLGDGGTTTHPSPVAVNQSGLSFTSIYAGGNHTCALTSTGAAYCWGLNNFGQTGTAEMGPPGCTTSDCRWTEPQPVAGDLSFSFLALGEYHTCGVVASGDTYCWGRNPGAGVTTGTGMITATPTSLAPRTSSPRRASSSSSSPLAGSTRAGSPVANSIAGAGV